MARAAKVGLHYVLNLQAFPKEGLCFLVVPGCVDTYTAGVVEIVVTLTSPEHRPPEIFAQSSAHVNHHPRTSAIAALAVDKGWRVC